MLWWLVDNASLLYLLLAVVALVLAGRWWLTRRGEYLLALGGTAVLAGLVWVLTLLVVTDRQRLVSIVRDVAERISKQDFNGAFAHFTDTVMLEFGGEKRPRSRADLQKLAEASLKKFGATGITVLNVAVDKLERPAAEVSFNVRPTDDPRFAFCRAEFVLLREGEWRVKAIKVEVMGR